MITQFFLGFFSTAKTDADPHLIDLLNFILAPTGGAILWMIFLTDFFKEKFYLLFIVTHEVRANKKRYGSVLGRS
jgi:hypothetical protein